MAFDTSTDVLIFFDTFESGAILQTSNSLSQSQKDAALLWSSWKSLVILLVLCKYYKYIFKNCKQTADFLKVVIFQITLMASLLSNGAQGNIFPRFFPRFFRQITMLHFFFQQMPQTKKAGVDYIWPVVTPTAHVSKFC